VSCERWNWFMPFIASWPVNIACPPGDRCVASPSGEMATRPRASTGLMVTLARTAALVVARSCAVLSLPFNRRPLPK
jgi:hypothetical protein